jgi:hypothetical protein
MVVWAKAMPRSAIIRTADAGSIIPGVTAGYRPFQAFALEPWSAAGVEVGLLHHLIHTIIAPLPPSI